MTKGEYPTLAYGQDGNRYISSGLTKTAFCKIVGAISGSSRNWIRERVSETGNKGDLEIGSRSNQRIYKVKKWTKEILTMYDLEGKKKK